MGGPWKESQVTQGMPVGTCPQMALSSQRSEAFISYGVTMGGKGWRACWLMRRIAISFRDVKS